MEELRLLKKPLTAVPALEAVWLNTEGCEVGGTGELPTDLVAENFFFRRCAF